MSEVVVNTTLICTAIWAVICRVRLMDPADTKPVVFVQHLLLAMGLFAGLILPPLYANTAILSGVLAFLTLGGLNWRWGAPGWTKKTDVAEHAPTEVDEKHHVHILGGRDHS